MKKTRQVSVAMATLVPPEAERNDTCQHATPTSGTNRKINYDRSLWRGDTPRAPFPPISPLPGCAPGRHHFMSLRHRKGHHIELYDTQHPTTKANSGAALPSFPLFLPSSAHTWHSARFDASEPSPSAAGSPCPRPRPIALAPPHCQRTPSAPWRWWSPGRRAPAWASWRPLTRGQGPFAPSDGGPPAC